MMRWAVSVVKNSRRRKWAVGLVELGRQRVCGLRPCIQRKTLSNSMVAATEYVY